MTESAAVSHVFDVTEQNFETDAVQASTATPILLDFWAAWCEPCKTLGPILEKLATEYNGAFRLGKVDAEAQQELATLQDEQSKLSKQINKKVMSMFEKVIYTGHDNYPEVIDYSGIWNSINNLNIVAWFRASNPDAKINLFFYQNSVGTGNPATWDWYVIMRNEESQLLCGT